LPQRSELDAPARLTLAGSRSLAYR
jgi:hypothetical protein